MLLGHVAVGIDLGGRTQDQRTAGLEALGQAELGHKFGICVEGADGAVNQALAQTQLDGLEGHVLQGDAHVCVAGHDLVQGREHDEHRRTVEGMHLWIAKGLGGVGVNLGQEVLVGDDRQVDAVVAAHADGGFVGSIEDGIQLLLADRLASVGADGLALVHSLLEFHESTFLVDDGGLLTFLMLMPRLGRLVLGHSCKEGRTTHLDCPSDDRPTVFSERELGVNWLCPYCL